MKVILPDTLLQAIRAEGERTYPFECCGFLLGNWSAGAFEVQAIWTATNAREIDAQRRRYLIRPQDYLEAEEVAGSQGMEVIGTFHSHPDHPALPSETDLAEATFPDFLYLIVSVRRGTAGDLTAWRLTPDRTAFEPVSIHPQTEVSP